MTSEEIPNLVEYLKESGFDVPGFAILLTDYGTELSLLEADAFREIDNPEGILTCLELQERMQLVHSLLKLISIKK